MPITADKELEGSEIVRMVVWKAGRGAEILFNNLQKMPPGAAWDLLVTAALVPTWDVDDDEKYGDAYEQSASKTQQDAIQEGQGNIQRPLLVHRDRGPLQNQVQIAPRQVPDWHRHSTSLWTVGVFLLRFNLNEAPRRIKKKRKNGQVIITFLNF